MGGEPVITGTRVPVRTIASLIEMGETHDVLREDYPHIPEEAYAVAVLWAHANPRCGRPARPWDTAASRPVRVRHAHRTREVLDRRVSDTGARQPRTFPRL
jgi:hypothetical protein